MEIGLGVFSGEVLPVEGVTQTRVLHDSIEQARLAESAGLDAVWITEHHFLDNGYVGSVLPFAAAMAARTERITVGLSVALGPLHDPIRLAEDSAFVDVLSGGRFALGLGLGYRDIEYEGFGTTRKARASRMEELCELLRQSWSDGPLDFDGRHFPRKGMEVFPKPVQEGGVPILMGGYAPPALDRTARWADGYIMDGGTDSAVFGKEGHNRDVFDRVAAGVEAYREALARHGKDTANPRFYLTLGGFLAEDGADAAWEHVAEAYMYTRRVYGDWYGLDSSEYEEWYPDKMSPEEHRRRRSEIMLGSPAELEEPVRRLRDIVGEGFHLMFRCKYPGVPDDVTRRSIELLGELRERVTGDRRGAAAHEAG